MPAPNPFSYALVRVVPHVEREEFVNAGVIVFCHAAGFLSARVALDEARLLALAPGADVALIRRHLDSIPQVCAGAPEGGPIARLPLRERWHWLIAPRSTMVQTSPAHAGLCDDPAKELERLLVQAVHAPLHPPRRAPKDPPPRPRG